MSDKTLAEDKWNEFFNTIDAKSEARSLFSPLTTSPKDGTQGLLGTPPFTTPPVEKVIAADDTNLLIPRAVTSLKSTFEGIWRDHLRFAVLCAVVVFVTTALLKPPLVRDAKGNRDWQLIFIYTLFSFLLTIFLPTFLNMSGSIASFLINFFS